MPWRKRVYCGHIRLNPAATEVVLMGWVDAMRDHGQVKFIHLRDTTGIVQVVFDPALSGDAAPMAGMLKEEVVVEVRGRVIRRQEGTENPNLETGRLEVVACGLKILSESKTLPFQISEKAMVFGEEIKASPEIVDEDLRLQHRYLDLRRPSVQEIFKKRYEIVKCIRKTLDCLNFVEIETPLLTSSTPEGARDYLVPSRVQRGKFYALPQSPQIFKQMLMMGGMDRYFQIARCFRDEDLRPNRQPEFTQLDLEASFIDEEFFYELVEELTVRIFSLGGISLPRPFPRMVFREAMERYGTDRPDLRFGMGFEDVTELLQETDYSVFRSVLRNGGHIKGFAIQGKGAALSKNLLQNEYAMKIAPSLGAKGLTWMKVSEGRLQSNIVRFFSPAEQRGLMERFRAKEGDVLMMIADRSLELVNSALSSLRLIVAKSLALIPRDRFCPLWVTHFPLFELKDGELGSHHHPFTLPDRIDFDPRNREELLSLNSRAFDLVVNGEELGGGSIRIHRRDVQERVFRALGLSREEMEKKFGFFLRALEYGTPPHGGLALGLDRVTSMILKTSSIRDVIAFPKNRSAICPLTRAPSEVKISQLKELGLLSGDFQQGPFKEGKVSRKESESGRSTKASRITKREVSHVARLARLSLDDREAEGYQRDLDAILHYVETLGALETEDVPAMSHVLDLKNRWREDKPERGKKRESLLSNAPWKEGDYFKVPKILEG